MRKRRKRREREVEKNKNIESFKMKILIEGSKKQTVKYYHFKI